MKLCFITCFWLCVLCLPTLAQASHPLDPLVMPVHKAGFKLMPVSFFSHNPALDVPK
ncbi:MAG: hypothetical protein HOP19_03550 [Acidobacteria bacterium]|nr:hypothetical protein [Acidobacteriota bacterium]